MKEAGAIPEVILETYRKLGLFPEQASEQLDNLDFSFPLKNRSVVQYRTVVSNGTGKIPQVVHAKLE